VRMLSPAAMAALAGPVIPIAALVEMDLTEPLFLNSSGMNLVLDGNTYLGLGDLGQIDAITETSAELPQVKFTLSGVDPTMLSLALQEPVQGKAVRVKFAIFDPSSGALLDVRMRYAGFLDVMAISDGKDSATIAVTSESAMLDLLRPGGLLYSDADQQALNPSDLSMQYINDQVEQKLVWPAASFFRR
jgi:hypothetical protein